MLNSTPRRQYAGPDEQQPPVTGPTLELALVQRGASRQAAHAAAGTKVPLSYAELQQELTDETNLTELLIQTRRDSESKVKSLTESLGLHELAMKDVATKMASDDFIKNELIQRMNGLATDCITLQVTIKTMSEHINKQRGELQRSSASYAHLKNVAQSETSN